MTWKFFALWTENLHTIFFTSALGNVLINFRFYTPFFLKLIAATKETDFWQNTKVGKRRGSRLLVTADLRTDTQRASLIQTHSLTTRALINSLRRREPTDRKTHRRMDAGRTCNDTYYSDIVTQRKPAVARKDALQPMQLLLQYWTSRSSKVNDFYVSWKPICDFLLVHSDQ